MNQNEHEPDFGEVDLKAEFKTLPERQAPRSLLPRVMEEVRRREAQSKPAGWFAWPVRLRVFSLCLAVTVLFVCAFWGFRLWQVHLEPELFRLSAVFQAVCGVLETILGKTLGIEGSEPNVLRYGPTLLGALLFALYLTLIGLGSAVYRAFRKIQL